MVHILTDLFNSHGAEIGIIYKSLVNSMNSNVPATHGASYRQACFRLCRINGPPDFHDQKFQLSELIQCQIMIQVQGHLNVSF